VKLKDAVSLPLGLRILLSETETEVMLKDVFQSRSSDSDVVLASGPEGGWTEEELNLFLEEGWISASLGSTILRAETAAIASLAVALSELQA
jgi:16S rRNA (uracil1498-N3)-methyltransferase